MLHLFTSKVFLRFVSNDTLSLLHPAAKAFFELLTSYSYRADLDAIAKLLAQKPVKHSDHPSSNYRGQELLSSKADFVYRFFLEVFLTHFPALASYLGLSTAIDTSYPERIQ